MNAGEDDAPYWYAAQDDWFLENALSARDSADLVADLMRRLIDHGLPVRRFSISFGALNPLFQGGNLIWQDGRLERNRFQRAGMQDPTWLRSPMKRVLDGPDRFLAWRLPDEAASAELPVLADLAGQGLRFYCVEALPFADPATAYAPPYDGMTISWAASEAAPFERGEQRWLKRLNRRIAGLSKTIGREHRALSILRTYFGPLVGPRIWQGRIARGDVETLQGVLWYSDLRNSTALAAALSPADFMGLLNDLFDCVAMAIEAAGGSVLKFVGDAVLAVFPQALPQAAECALEAAVKARTAQAEANRRRAEAGAPTIAFGIGLRHGSVLFGNVGAPDRLDFTVIGPAVNEVVRMEELTKELDDPLVVDATVRQAVAAPSPGSRWRALGERSLRGVEHPLALFVPQSP